MTYPKDIQGNIRYRANILENCFRDLEYARNVKALCERNILFFFNTFLYTYDPRTVGKHLPFVTWDFQDEYILELNDAIEKAQWGNERQDVFTDKSRDMGVTWMVLGVFLWRFLFKSGEEFRVGSRKEEFVDKSGDMDTLFEKLRYMQGKLPWFLQPHGWDSKKHQPYMKMVNKESKNSIIGEATNKDFARGGRKKAVFFDEFPAWENATEAWQSCTDSTLCKIAVGTPDGSGNKFAELKRGDEIRRKYNLMWWKHPRKTFTSPEHLEVVKSGGVWDKVSGYTVQLHQDQKAPKGCYVDQHGKLRSEWYDRDCKDRDSDDIAQNLDCSYLTSGRPIFDTLKCNQRLYESESPKFIGDLHWKVRPMFDAVTGYCVNQDQLAVEFVENMNGLFQIWEKPEAGYENGYIIGADTAEGLEQHDYDAASCLKRFGPKPKFVAKIQAHIKMHEYAEELAKFGVYYNNAIVNVERNNHGHGVLAHLVKLYRFLFHKAIFTKGYAEITDTIGHDTTSQSKPVIIGTLGRAISKEEFEDKDEGFWKETLTFVDDNGKMEAQGKRKGEKCFDDQVIAHGITWWSHLNMPLPAMVRKKVPPPEGWRKRQVQGQKSLVGFAV